MNTNPSADKKTISLPTFTLPNGEKIIRDRQMQYAYRKYRENYRKVTKVAPEFDSLHHPVCGVLPEYLVLPENLEAAMKANTKSGALQILTTSVRMGTKAVDYGRAPWNRTISHANRFIPSETRNLQSIITQKDYHIFPLFKKAYKEIISKYLILYSAIANTDPEEIISMKPGSYFYSQYIGAQKLENGIYAEGTWKNGKFVYGLAYHPKTGFMAGTFDGDGNLIDGVALNHEGLFSFGTFNSDGEAEGNNVRLQILADEFSDSTPCYIQVGNFLHNHENGFFFEFLLQENNIVSLREVKYDFGKEVKMSHAEKKDRKKDHSSSLYERMLGYLRNILFIIIAVVLTCMVGQFGILSILFAIPFGIFGVLGLRKTLKQSKRAKELKS